MKFTDNSSKAESPDHPLHAKAQASTAINTKRAYLTFAIVALAFLMSSLDSTIVAVALPTLIADLRTNLALVGWTLTGYLFAQSVIMPIAGKLSDELGRKRLFLAAVVLFTVSSMAAGLAPNIYLLIIIRIIQGIGGGAFLPSATGIVSDAFGERRAPAIGLFGSIFPIGGILGPNIGGFIVDHFSWRWIFYVNVPIGVALFLCGMAFLPKSNKTVSYNNQKLDFAGVGLFVGGVLAVLYGITNWANNPGQLGTMIMTWVLFVVSLIFFCLFVWHENRTGQPMIEIKLLRWRPFLAANAYNFIFGTVVFGFFAFIPYYATVAYNMTAGQAGLVLTPRSIAMIVTSAISSIFIIRLRYRLPMIGGIALISLSLFLLSRGYHDLSIFGVGFHNLLLLALLVLISGIGTGIANPASNNAALDLTPEKVAAVAGMRGMFRTVGGVIGTAAVTLALSYFPDKALGMQNIYMVFSVLILLVIPLVFLIPERARERRRIHKIPQLIEH